MTAYITCVECNTDVPWYYAFLNGSEPMHPGCAQARIDEEGCGAIAAAIREAGFRERDALDDRIAEGGADAPLTREQQVKFMTEASERRQKSIERWKNDPEIREFLQQKPGYTATQPIFTP